MNIQDLFNKNTRSVKPIRTRFRAYKMGKAGSLCSYFAGNHFTLIEAMDSETSRPNLIEEMSICGKEYIDTLHITSWDNDHCEVNALEWILDKLKPTKIELPGYSHDSKSAEECQELINQYNKRKEKKTATTTSQKANVIVVNPEYISSLDTATTLGYVNIFYNPIKNYTESNNNSTVKFFRSGAFNVLSTGDIENHEIGAYLRKCKKLCREIDILILPHHGGPVDLMTKKFLEGLRPSLAVCTSNTSNQYEHPDPAIRKLLHNLDIPLMTTIRGDVIIESLGKHVKNCQAYDLLSDGKTIQNQHRFEPRKYALLSMNSDTIRDRFNHRRSGPRGS